MGNCCCPEKEESQTLTNTGGRAKPFQGEGHRLGTAAETKTTAGSYHDQKPTAAAVMQRDDIPEPAIDPNLTEEQRAKIRADRAAAAEARLKKMGGGSPKKKKATPSDAPLVGPNSQPTMRWTAG